MKSLIQSLFKHLSDLLSGIQKRIPRLTSWGLVAAALLVAVAVLHPSQLTVVLWKLCLVALAAPMAYWIDRAMSPYGRPHRMDCDTRRDIAMFRRAIIFLAVVLGLTLGL